MNTYEQIFSIRYSELNRHGLLKDEAFFDIFQEVASRHAEKLGCGFGTMGSMTWFLSKMRIQVLRTPAKGDLTVKTWPSGFSGLYAIRQALFYDALGEIAHVTSYWLLINLNTLRPQRLPGSLPCSIPENPELPRYFDLSIVPRIPRTLDLSGHPRIEVKNPLESKVAEHEIDVNQHLNNARYCSRISDWLAQVTGRTPSIVDITAVFQHETQVNTLLTTKGTIDDQGNFQAAITSEKDDYSELVHFTAVGRIAMGGNENG